MNQQSTQRSSDDLFSALASGIGANRPVDYRLRVDQIRQDALRPLGFAEISRMTLLRCLLAALGADIFETDLSRVALERADELPRAIEEVEKSTVRAARWLRERIGVAGPRALPYALQFVLLSEFFRQGREPTAEVAKRLEKWVWTTSFNTSFAVGRPTHFDRAVRTARELATNPDVTIPDLDLRALPFPGKFHARSARVRGFFLALKRLRPRSLVTGNALPWPDLLDRGLHDTMRISDHPDPWSLADRVLVGGDDVAGGPLDSLQRLRARDPDLWKLTLDSHALTKPAWDALVKGDAEEFVTHRRAALEEMEGRLFKEMSILPPESGRADEESEDAPIEAEDIDDPGE